jgi:hypothetical protein
VYLGSFSLVSTCRGDILCIYTGHVRVSTLRSPRISVHVLPMIAFVFAANVHAYVSLARMQSAEARLDRVKDNPKLGHVKEAVQGIGWFARAPRTDKLVSVYRVPGA